MTKWLLAAAALSAGLVPLGACTGKNDSGPCQIGSLGCYCYANQTCDDDLQCVPVYEVCRMSSDGLGGAPAVGEGGGGGKLDENGAGGDGAPSGAPSTGGGGASGNQGGSSGQAGSSTAGGGSGGSGGSTTNPFPDSAVGCALVTS